MIRICCNENSEIFRFPERLHENFLSTVTLAIPRSGDAVAGPLRRSEGRRRKSLWVLRETRNATREEKGEREKGEEEEEQEQEEYKSEE